MLNSSTTDSIEPAQSAWPWPLGKGVLSQSAGARDLSQTPPVMKAPRPDRECQGPTGVSIRECREYPLYVESPEVAASGWAAQARAPSPGRVPRPGRIRDCRPPRLRGHGEPPRARGHARVVARPPRPRVEVGVVVEAAPWGARPRVLLWADTSVSPRPQYGNPDHATQRSGKRRHLRQQEAENLSRGLLTRQADSHQSLASTGRRAAPRECVRFA